VSVIVSVCECVSVIVSVRVLVCCIRGATMRRRARRDGMECACNVFFKIME
jgi:hypothetical protein